jgi:hypothetical protein
MHTHKTKGTSGDIVRSVRYMSPSSPNRGVAQSHGVDRVDRRRGDDWIGTRARTRRGRKRASA